MKRFKNELEVLGEILIVTKIEERKKLISIIQKLLEIYQRTIKSQEAVKMKELKWIASKINNMNIRSDITKEVLVSAVAQRVVILYVYSDD